MNYCTQRDGWNWLGAHKGWTLQGIYKYVKMPRNSMSLQFTALDFPPCCHQNPAECGQRGCPLSVTPQRCAEKCRILGLRVGRFINSPFWVIKKHLFLAGIYPVMRPALCLTDLELSRTGSAVSGAGITNWNEQKHCYSCRISHLR